MNGKARNMRSGLHSALAVIGVLAFLACARNGLAADVPAVKPHQAADQSNDMVIARVDGTPIYQSELNAGLPRDLFGVRGALKAAKFERLISETIVAQFLARAAIEIASAEIDAEVENLRQNPPPAECLCCRYASLEQYMRANGYDMAELRRKIANDIGMRRLAAEWSKHAVGMDKASDQAEARIRSEYQKVSHIFFNTYQKPDFRENPDGVRNLAMSRAGDALERLAHGDKFEDVAVEMSEDANSSKKGGRLGCIPRDAVGPAFASAVDTLKPGEYSKPIVTQWGVHIIRRETMTDADVLDIVRWEYIAEKKAAARRDMLDTVKVERFWEPK